MSSRRVSEFPCPGEDINWKMHYFVSFKEICGKIMFQILWKCKEKDKSEIIQSIKWIFWFSSLRASVLLPISAVINLRPRAKTISLQNSLLTPVGHVCLGVFLLDNGRLKIIVCGSENLLFAVKEQPVRDLREAPRTSHNETHKSGFRLETFTGRLRNLNCSSIWPGGLWVSTFHKVKWEHVWLLSDDARRRPSVVTS